MNRIHWITVSVLLISLTALTAGNQSWDTKNYFNIPTDAYKLPVFTQKLPVNQVTEYMFQTSDCILLNKKPQVAVKASSKFTVANNCLYSVITAEKIHKPP